MESTLTEIMDLTTRVMNAAPDKNNLTSFGNAVLAVNKKLVSTMKIQQSAPPLTLLNLTEQNLGK